MRPSPHRQASRLTPSAEFEARLTAVLCPRPAASLLRPCCGPRRTTSGAQGGGRALPGGRAGQAARAASRVGRRGVSRGWEAPVRERRQKGSESGCARARLSWRGSSACGSVAWRGVARTTSCLALRWRSARVVAARGWCCGDPRACAPVLAKLHVAVHRSAREQGFAEQVLHLAKSRSRSTMQPPCPHAHNRRHQP
jgi:hypothetical protein